MGLVFGSASFFITPFFVFSKTHPTSEKKKKNRKQFFPHTPRTNILPPRRKNHSTPIQVGPKTDILQPTDRLIENPLRPASMGV